MLEKKITNYMKGYIVIEVTGKFIERFINIAIFQGLAIWDINKLDNTKMEMKVSRHHFSKLKPIAKTAMVEFAVAKKYGVFNEINRIKGRYALIIGVLLTILIIVASSMLIWKVEFIGEIELLSAPQRETLEKSLVENNIAIFRSNAAFDGSYLKDVLLKQNPDIAWIWVSITGNKATVDVRVKTKSAPMVDITTPANIVATKSGVVTMIIPRAGMKRVEVNSTIEKGQVLISAEVESEYIDTRIVRARGDVYARTWYEERGDTDLKVNEKRPTGQEKVINYMKIGKKTINLSFNSSILYEKYDTIEEDGVTFLPTISFGKRIYREYEDTLITLTDSQGEAVLRQKLQGQIDAQLSKDNKLVAEDFVFEKVGGKMVGKLCSEYIESVSESANYEAPFPLEQEEEESVE